MYMYSIDEEFFVLRYFMSKNYCCVKYTNLLPPWPFTVVRFRITLESTILLFGFRYMYIGNPFITDTTKTVLYMEVPLIQMLGNTVKYYCGMRTSVLNREMPFVQSVLNKEVPLYYGSSGVAF